jgi:hypothetical protein
MTKLTLEIPDNLHRTVKSFASAHGETIKDFFVDAVVTKLKTSHKTKTKIPTKTMKKPHKKNSKYITEKEADKLLRPYLLRLIQRIENGEEETYSWDEVMRGLKKV